MKLFKQLRAVQSFHFTCLDGWRKRAEASSPQSSLKRILKVHAVGFHSVSAGLKGFYVAAFCQQ